MMQLLKYKYEKNETYNFKMLNIYFAFNDIKVT